jgi:hypothetical protein
MALVVLAVGLRGDKLAMRSLACSGDVVVDGPDVPHQTEIIAQLRRLPMDQRSAALRDTVFAPQMRATESDVRRAMASPDAVLVTSVGLGWHNRRSVCIRFEVSGNQPGWVVCLPVPGGVGWVGPHRQRSDKSGRWLAGFGSMAPACGDELREAMGAGCDAVGDFDGQMRVASGLVHHGGYGSTVAAIRAWIPQVICPVLQCQHDMGALIERLGLGACRRPDETIADAMARASTSYSPPD